MSSTLKNEHVEFSELNFELWGRRRISAKRERRPIVLEEVSASGFEFLKDNFPGDLKIGNTKRSCELVYDASSEMVCIRLGVTDRKDYSSFASSLEYDAVTAKIAELDIALGEKFGEPAYKDCS